MVCVHPRFKEESRRLYVGTKLGYVCDGGKFTSSELTGPTNSCSFELSVTPYKG